MKQGFQLIIPFKKSCLFILYLQSGKRNYNIILTIIRHIMDNQIVWQFNCLNNSNLRINRIKK
ncbi:hypothetical protein EGY05_22500 [Chryseobacterium arthrosphaerae]|nr:hypothetical protein EGY05_22500 [Chryseobacterium arthrosphaerae]